MISDLEIIRSAKPRSINGADGLHMPPVGPRGRAYAAGGGG
jgi:hypothetical protein